MNTAKSLQSKVVVFSK